MKISRELLGITRDFEFFCREKFQPVFLGPATSADRPAKSAESAIFWRKCEKHDLKSSFHKMAGNGRIFSKKILVNLLTLLFSKNFFFSKKLPNFKNIGFGQNLAYFLPFFINWLQILILFWEIDNIFRKMFWYVFEHYCFEKKFFFEKKLTNFKILRFFGFFQK